VDKKASEHSSGAKQS